MVNGVLYVVNINSSGTPNPNGRTMRYLWKKIDNTDTLIGRAIKGIGYVRTIDSLVTGYTTTAELSKPVSSLSKFRVDSDDVRLYYYFKLTTDAPRWSDSPLAPGINEGYSYSADGKVKIDLDSTHTSRRITMRLPKGDYILSLNNTSADITGLTLTYNQNELSEFGYPDVTNFEEAGRYNIEFTSENAGGQDIYGYKTAIFVTATSVAAPTSIFIEKVFRYRFDDTNANEIDMDAVSDKIKYLLRYSEYPFDYTYQIPKNDVIVNPLQAESFFNVGHVLHPYMICQLDTTNSAIAISGDN